MEITFFAPRRSGKTTTLVDLAQLTKKKYPLLRIALMVPGSEFRRIELFADIFGHLKDADGMYCDRNMFCNGEDIVTVCSHSMKVSKSKFDLVFIDDANYMESIGNIDPDMSRVMVGELSRIPKYGFPRMVKRGMWEWYAQPSPEQLLEQMEAMEMVPVPKSML